MSYVLNPKPNFLSEVEMELFNTAFRLIWKRNIYTAWSTKNGTFRKRSPELINLKTLYRRTSDSIALYFQGRYFSHAMIHVESPEKIGEGIRATILPHPLHGREP